ncbi:Kunitz/Bovine pancreatic trypsin inhibitor domain protein [Thiorhodovibrio winogradskyi]|uniref:Kunitz/Bovine pancreatic trypsin inhibitor domain protein n=2 Tax=Thiorhodovibrio winogradskyi TaxID=77007 RepID=A0ABZ0S7N1_9GAMM
MALFRAFHPNYLVPAFAATFLLSGCMNSGLQKDLIHVDCMTPPDPGPCKGAFPGFFYDYESNRCQRFTYGGCDGARPFESMKACIKACRAKAGP